MYFLDFDVQPETMGRHGSLRDHYRQVHPNAWWRHSSSGHMHVISEESILNKCQVCSGIHDRRYNGQIFFNNKGDKWADPLWQLAGDPTKTRFFLPTMCLVWRSYIENTDTSGDDQSDYVEWQYFPDVATFKKKIYGTFRYWERPYQLAFYSMIVNTKFPERQFNPVSQDLNHDYYHEYLYEEIPSAWQSFVESIPCAHKAANHIDLLVEHGYMPLIGKILL